jgi:DNA-binding NtrC family response regulator
MNTILIIDDKHSILESLDMFLTEKGHRVLKAATAGEGLALYKRHRPEVVILDIRLPDANGIDVLAKIQIHENPAKVIMMTAFQDMETTIQAMKLGAYDYIHKPLDVDKVEQAVDRALYTLKIDQEAPLIAEVTQPPNSEVIIGKSDQMRKIFKTIGLLSQNRAPVLIQGETGTGKELIARVIHRNSLFAKEPFITFDCSAVVETLLESELFGHEKGAFTGATQQRKGRFELADTGTIFLDEVSEMPVNTQVKLLRVLQEGEFERVGGSKTLKVDVRVVAATNQNLEEMVAAGTFRKDLFYRLNVIHLEIPPLRARSEDIPLLAQHFLDKFCLENSRPPMGFTPEAMQALKNYLWPGNVRELENVVERAVALCSSSAVGLADLPEEVQQQSDGEENIVLQVGASMEEIEKLAIRQTFKKTGGDKEVAARILGIGLATLYRRLKEMDAKEDSAPEPTPKEE